MNPERHIIDTMPRHIYLKYINNSIILCDLDKSYIAYQDLVTMDKEVLTNVKLGNA